MYIKCVFGFFNHAFLKNFILRRFEEDMIKLHFGLHLTCRYFCHVLTKLEFSQRFFEK